MTSYDLTPLFRSTIGFDRISNLLDSAFKVDDRTLSYPPYNIEKLDEDSYRITMAVAGFKPEELDINVQENMLTVSGEVTQQREEKGVSYLHKGIATRNFSRQFSLADHVKVTGAKLADGLLQLQLAREVPEASKPRSIAIETADGTKVSKKTLDLKKAS